MAYKGLIAALGTLLAASQALASQPEPSPQTGAPPASPNARYCLRVDPITGSRQIAAGGDEDEGKDGDDDEEQEEKREKEREREMMKRLLDR